MTGDGVLGWLIDASHRTTADQLPALLAGVAERIGATGLDAYLVDLEQCRMSLLGGTGEGDDVLGVDGTLAGRVFRSVEVRVVQGPDGTTVWLPILDGTERLGVLRFTFPDGTAVDGDLQHLCRRIGGLLAELVVSKIQYGDTLHRARRRSAMSLAAELQHHLMPPLTCTVRRVAVSGVLEPAYTVAGDVFDYAVDGDDAWVAVFDGMGHGLEAALMTSLAVAAFRHVRRRGDDLAAMYQLMSAVVDERFGPDGFVTALVAHLDTATGQLTWFSAGHPLPILLRQGKRVAHVGGSRNVPLGVGQGAPELAVASLEPFDTVLLFTDGIVEARAADGEPFGEDRLVDFVIRELAAGQNPAETVRRLASAVLDHQQAPLTDDATLLLVQWRGPHDDPPPPLDDESEGL